MFDIDKARGRIRALTTSIKDYGYDGSASVHLNVMADKVQLYAGGTDEKINKKPDYRNWCDDNNYSYVAMIGYDDLDIDKMFDDAVSALHQKPTRHQRELNIIAVKAQMVLAGDQDFSREVRDSVVAALRKTFADLGLPMLTDQTKRSPVYEPPF